jgi:hypothetical protein
MIPTPENSKALAGSREMISLVAIPRTRTSLLPAASASGAPIIIRSMRKADINMIVLLIMIPPPFQVIV